MKMRLDSISDRGVNGKERLGFVAERACNAKNFVVFASNKTKGGFHNRSKNAFWFPAQSLNAGDRVVLYTSKAGSMAKKPNEHGTSTYFFYWGLDAPLLERDKDLVVLAEVPNWKLSTSL